MSMQNPNPYNPVDPMHQTSPRMPLSEQHTEQIKLLNSLLKGELAALDTYAQALEKVDDTPELFSTLTNVRLSHESRSRKLTQRVLDLGGEPATSAGAWGAFAKFLEGGAKLFGDKAAIAVLEEGEDKGLRDYTDAIEKCGGLTCDLLQFDLLPEQKRTHDMMSSLKDCM